MLYASTVATLKREFGLTYITQEIRATSIVKFFSKENKVSFSFVLLERNDKSFISSTCTYTSSTTTANNA